MFSGNLYIICLPLREYYVFNTRHNKNGSHAKQKKKKIETLNFVTYVREISEVATVGNTEEKKWN